MLTRWKEFEMSPFAFVLQREMRRTRRKDDGWELVEHTYFSCPGWWSFVACQEVCVCVCIFAPRRFDCKWKTEMMCRRTKLE